MFFTGHNRVFCWFFIICCVSLGQTVSKNTQIYSGHKLVKREEAFDLVKIEATFNKNEEGRGFKRRDSVPSEEKCQEKCNDDLRAGLDMVKAHTSFGSIGVPSVNDRLDLIMFCRLDSAHDECLRRCGYEVQFNMRDFVCQTHFNEMIQNQPCYQRAAAFLKRRCGERRCGPYTDLELSVVGFGNRCRTLVCDLACSRTVLLRQCGTTNGSRASRFLVDYTKAQITTWMRETSTSMHLPISQIMPSSCARIFCPRFNCSNDQTPVV
uniref:Domain of unknown function DB domain-containing protein n=1 Tax=Acrobeloides nanus TaxID=290746 RepID=A0A914DK40_9BILA